MTIRRVCALYFSPAGSTRALAVALATALAKDFSASMASMDLTLPAAREYARSFQRDDLVVCGSPTYAGKLPNKLLPYWKEQLSGNGALAVALVTFGNRAFDHALAELCACLSAEDFHVVGAGAFTCRHVFSDVLAAPRPDQADYAALFALGAAVAARVAGTDEVPSAPTVPGDADASYYTPVGLDGEPKNFLKAKPKTTAECMACGICAASCPMGAIDFADVANVPGLCIKCHACVRNCPVGAKYFDDPAFLSHRAMLEQTFQRRAETKWFV